MIVGKAALILIGVSVLLFVVCDIIELIFNYRESKSEQEAYTRCLEEENEALRQEGKYWRHLTEVMIQCRDFIQ